MKKILALIILINITATCIHAQSIDLNYYSTHNVSYNTKVPTPKQIVGHEVGEWHISHDKLVYYMQTLANSSDRISIQTTGHTFENRPLLLLTITSPENHANLEEIRKKHLLLSDPASSRNLPLEDMPAVVYMGYSVHGNEASGSNAAMLLAYHLAAGEGKEIEEILSNTVILLDPSLNPDGLQRFSTWVNSRKGFNNSTNSMDMEHNEDWPGGRTNHYWFDLNRDWLTVQLPESRARINTFHHWRPNVLTDHHEMATNSTFFFQPGIPSRNNPLTPSKVYDLTAKMAEYHARALDKIGALYYTKESFDDYFFGKGSTYPDINGGVGILFEQASARGHAQESSNGKLTFPFAVRNQFITSLSTIKAVNAMKIDFLEHQRQFYIEAEQSALRDKDKAFLVASKDLNKNFHFAEMLSSHGIELFRPQRAVNISGTDYKPNEAYIIPTSQPQYFLIKAIFERRTEFIDSLFYDVSTWTMPLAFNMDHKTLSGGDFNKDMLGKKYVVSDRPVGGVKGEATNYAYAFDWQDYYAPKLLYQLMNRGLNVKVAHKPFNGHNTLKFERGSIIIPAQNQNIPTDTLYNILNRLANLNGINIYPLTSGLDLNGISLGSPAFAQVQAPEVLLLVGDGVSAYDAGEVWHLLDYKLDMNITLMDIAQFNNADLSRYNTLIMVDGNYTAINTQGKEQLKFWLRNGGNIIALQSALKYINSSGLAKFEFVNTSHQDSSHHAQYADIASTKGAEEIGGAIFKVHVDLSHPLLYGYEKNTLPIFRNNTLFLKKSSGNFSNPILYSKDPLLSGYISARNLNLLSETSAVGIRKYGKGKVIGFTDNLNFRAFWYGTNKIFLNAIFYGNLIDPAASR